MNSVSERRSPQELIAQAQRNIQAANSAQPCVAVTEPNWKAMIQTQRTQIELLSELQKTQTEGLNEIREAMQTLTTKDEIVDYLRQQLDELERYTEAVSEASMEYQRAMREEADRIRSELETAVAETEILAGKLNGKFSDSLLSEQKRMNRHTMILFGIAVIPSILLLILQWMLYLWPQVFPG